MKSIVKQIVNYWKVEDFTKSTRQGFPITLRITGCKTNIRGVEATTGYKLRVARKTENPDIIVEAGVIVNGVESLECRRERGTLIKHYMIKESPCTQ